MIKMVTASRRRAGLLQSEMLHHAQHIHGDIARAKPMGVRRYVQNHVFDAAYGALGDATHVVSARDSVTELYFDDVEALRSTMTDPYTRDVVVPDGAKYTDRVSNVSLIAEETFVPVPETRAAGGPGGLKCMHFMMRAAELRDRDFADLWRRYHQNRVLRQPSAYREALRAGRLNVALPDSADHMEHFFGRRVATIYDAAYAFWLDADAGPQAVRAYLDAMTALNAERPVLDASRSFVLLVKEVPIMDFT